MRPYRELPHRRWWLEGEVAAVEMGQLGGVMRHPLERIIFVSAAAKAGVNHTFFGAEYL